ncbi:hypothetical protein ACXYTP_23515 [Tsukamurella ocularis]
MTLTDDQVAHARAAVGWRPEWTEPPVDQAAHGREIRAGIAAWLNAHGYAVANRLPYGERQRLQAALRLTNGQTTNHLKKLRKGTS